MSDRVQDLTNHRKVAVACKNYTDKQVKKAKDELITFFSRNTVDTDDHTNELAYQITAPANAKLLMLQSIGGNTVKYNPSVASDSTKAMIKTMPSTVYTFDGSKFYGDSEVSENLIVLNDVAETTVNGITYSITNGVLTLNGTSNGITNITNITNVVNSQIAKMDTSNYTLKWFTNLTSFGSLSGFVGFNNYYDNYITLNNGNTAMTNDVNIGTKIQINSSATFNNVKLMPMLVKGTTAPTEFKAGYTGIHNIELTGLKVECANLFDIRNATTFGNISYNANTCEITTTTSSYGNQLLFSLLLPKGTYTLMRNVDGNVNSILYSGETNVAQIGYTLKKQTFTLSQDTTITSFRTSLNGTQKFVIVRGNVAYDEKYFVPYITPTTKTIDLTTIVDSNNNKLFPNGKLMGNANVKDILGVYNQESKWVDLLINGSKAWYKNTGWSSEDNISMYFRPTVLPVNGTLNLFCTDNTFTLKGNVLLNSTTTDEIRVASDAIYVNFTRGGGKINEFTLEKAKQWLANNLFTLQYERATYLTSNTDLSATLRNIQGYPNGSIIAENTNNMDVESVITYNSIIQETLCPSVTVDGANRFDKSNVLNRTYIHSDGTLKTETTDGWITSQPIEIEDSVSFNFNTIQVRYRLLDENQNYIANSYALTTNASGTITNSVNATYIQFSIRINDEDTFMVVKGSTVPTTYRAYKPSITRNLPTQASDGWSAGTSRNYRVFCDDEGNEVLKRENNVNKEDLGDKTWQLYSGNTFLTYRSGIDGISTSSIVPLLTTNYNTVTTDFGSINDKEITSRGGGALYVAIRDDLYSSYTDFKNSLTNVPLYYKLADASKTETDMDDFDYFFDVEEGDVITFNNPYAQQVYATYSFLIKEAKSNE